MSVRTVRPVRTALAAVAVAAAVALTAPAAANASGPAPEKSGGGHRATQKALEAAVADGVPGALAQARDGRHTWTGAAGVADLTSGRERQGKDVYRVGSITKTFVATVLLQLEAEGRLDLDDTVDRWLPGVVKGNGHDGRRITLRQLLNHTSGVYSVTSDPEFQDTIFGPGFLEHRYDTWTPRQLVAIAMTHKPDFAPGTSWNYSNTNYVLAGMVIEKATGRPYGKEVERRIIKPLKLRSTSVPGKDVTMPKPSGRAYSKLNGDPKPGDPVHDVTELSPTIAHAAGEMISNSGDLQRFYRALLGGELLPPAQLKAMTDTVTVTMEGVEFGYGLGLMKQKLSCGTEVWGHGGGIHGSSSQAQVTRDARHSLALNFNGDWSGDSQKVVEAEFCGK
ncbi:serine hydrolase domain-containing protein [Streptomyces purpureus]|uniref:serine hydrolase domain-containing protein n=1 Tax=Streptomyces purpureus TaxID=1951 RepID=UPI00039C77B7|nr:serine hydrolase domain-containing protein [Streptomyces purpureus]